MTVLTPMGFRKTPFTREVPIAERFSLGFQMEVVQALQETVAQRLAHAATLRLLSRDESRAYIEHRCLCAGAPLTPFDTDAMEVLFELSRGNLRAIDRLALKSIMVANKAGASVVSSGDVLAAKEQLWL